MTDIYVKVRLADVTLYTKLVTIDLKKPVSALKKLLCDTYPKLRLNRLILAYCGSVMDDDSRPLHTYELMKYAMVHVFIETKNYPKPPKPLSPSDIIKVSVALKSLKYSSPFKTELLKLRYPEDIGDLILSTPGLNKDVTARTLLLRPDFLLQIGEQNKVPELNIEHPALGLALLQLINTSSVRGSRDNSMQLNSSNDNGTDTLLPSTASEGSSSSVAGPSTSETTITSAQLALAISNVTTAQSLHPSTSGAGTSHATSGQVQIDVARQLQLMNDMGLTDDAVNREALEQSSSFEMAIESVLNRSTFTDTNEQNNQ